MMKWKQFIVVVACLTASVLVFADSLELKNGSLIKGQYMGGTETEISFRVGSSIQHYPVSDVLSLKFDSIPSSASAVPAGPSANAAGASVAATSSASAPAKPAASVSSQTTSKEPALASRPSTSASAPAASTIKTSAAVTVPAGTALMVRTIDAVDSDKNQAGDRFQASLEEALTVNGAVVAPKGTIVYGRLEEVKAAGQLSGKSELQLSLTGIAIDGKTYPLTTGDYSIAGESRTTSTATRVGGGAALGALIGAIAGGGKGAAIGAGVGAGAGTAAQVMTKGEQVHVPSETLLQFTLSYPANLPAPK